ncbi:amino acid permease 6 [Camellia sinensis]|uniref:amino acid permease 6 n=1 Tax=Camellia sinensis TaxID=4442 RepID=UPI0010368ECD|nr:amino acid permease 6 [Camellia sinensis]
MARETQNKSMFIEQAQESLENADTGKNFDDDGRPKRTGSVVTASAHIITAVIGSGVLSLAWAIAQLGWVAGPAVLMAFSFITYFTSTLLADCYRSPDPVTGTRNYTYMDVVRAHLGGIQVKLCGIAQYGNLIGVTIGYTITASISMVAVNRSNCFHKYGHHVKCSTSNYPFMIIFAIIQIILSQIPNFHKLSWLSILAAVMSFAYSSIGVGLSIAKVAGGAHARTSLTGVTVGVDVSASEKVWRSFQAIGDIAFAYAYSTVLIEIQDTLKSHPPENRVMKKASLVGVSTTTLFYASCGCLGYAAFGNNAPGNFLTGFGFYEPFWLIDFANVCIAVHLIGAYQVFCQPIFAFAESRCHKRWPDRKFITSEYAVKIPFWGAYYINLFRLVWRTTYVILTAVLAMIFPFFNDFLGLIGAASFYPLTVYFPIEMHIAQSKIPRFSFTWIWLKILSWACLVISLVAAIGSIQGLAVALKTYKPFKTQN